MKGKRRVLSLVLLLFVFILPFVSIQKDVGIKIGQSVLADEKPAEIPDWVHIWLEDLSGNLYYSGGTNFLAILTGYSGSYKFTIHSEGGDWHFADEGSSQAEVNPSSGPEGASEIEISNIQSSDYGKSLTFNGYQGAALTLPIQGNASSPTLKVHDLTIEVGDAWSPEDNFDSATNSKGDDVPFSEGLVIGNEVDTSQPGEYLVTYTNGEYMVGTATVTVKGKTPKVAAPVIVRYVDESGNSLHETQELRGEVGDTYDTSTPEYQLKLKGYNLDQTKLPENIKGTFTETSQEVTYVYQGILELSVPADIDFGSYMLGTSNPELSYPGGDVIVTNYTGNAWTLSAELEENGSDFSNYLMNGTEKLSENPILAQSLSTSDITTTVSDFWGVKQGLWVDYSSATELRNDSEVLNWILSPAVEDGVKE